MKLINPLIILRILSTILLIETISYFCCLPVALYYKEALFPFLLSALTTAVLYVILRVSSIKADTSKMSNRDGFLAVNVRQLRCKLG